MVRNLFSGMRAPGKQLIVFLFFFSGVINILNSQIRYAPLDERKEAGIGVERVARFFTPAYESPVAQKDTEVRWVQIDLGTKRKITAIKLLPRVSPWGYVTSVGFPVRFKIEISEDPDFKNSILYVDQIREDFRDPGDEVCTFAGKEVSGRFVRLTALRLRQQRLALTKFMIMSGSVDVAEGRPASDSQTGSLGISVLTRASRPQGEGVRTDNPSNVIPFEKWNPVKYKANAPKSGVRIKDGIFLTTMKNNMAYLMNSFTADELVRNFRVKAGKPVAPLEDRLNNFWFVDLPGQEAGRFLMGAGNTLRWIENPSLRERMNFIVDVIDDCKEPDGYIMAYPKYKIFSGEFGAYTRSWVTHGLIEAGYAGNDKAFPLLRGFYDWFNNSVYLPEMLRRAGQGTQGIIPSTRVYFSPAGDPQDIITVQRYFQENYWMEQLAKREEKAIWLYPYDRPHNYLLTGIEPYLDLYRATGVKKYLDAAEGGWDLYHENWEHTGGSIAICEGTELYPPKSYYLHRNTGELCGSVFWTFLNQRFHLLTPDVEKYVAEIEKSIYNNLIANQVDSSGIRYHSVLVERKDWSDRQPFAMSTCCEGQGTRMMGALPEFIYSVADDGIYVDLYAPSEVDFQTAAGRMTLKMDTQFPYSPKVTINVNVEKPFETAIRIRIPSWASKDVTVVHGRKKFTGKPGTYITIFQKWRNNDKISFTLPMDFKLTRYEGVEKFPDRERYAVEYGPLLMAYVNIAGNNDNINLPFETSKAIRSLKPVAGKPLHFSVEGVTDCEFMPYFEVQSQPFSCYP